LLLSDFGEAAGFFDSSSGFYVGFAGLKGLPLSLLFSGCSG